MLQIAVVGNTFFTKYCLDYLISPFSGYKVNAIVQADNWEELGDYHDLSSFAKGNKIDYHNYPSLVSGTTAGEVYKLFSSLKANNKLDAILVMGFPYLLHSSVIKLAPCIASYPGILPEHSGDSPIPWTIIKKISESGLTFYKMREGHPFGNIILQTKFYVADNVDASALYEQINDCAEDLLESLRLQLELGLPKQIIFKDSAIKHFFASFGKNDCQIHWELPCEEIARLIRAASFPYYGARFKLGNTSMIAWQGTLGKFKTDLPPGELVYQDDNHLVITTGTVDLDITRHEVLIT